nr:acetyltransferase [Darna trima granulovirus]
MDTLIPFGSNTLCCKRTHRQYCGFYSLEKLSCIYDDTVVVNGKQYWVSDDIVIDWAYDGLDTIVSQKRLVYTRQRWILHDPIYNINNCLVGLVTRGTVSNNDYVYALHDGDKLQSFQFFDTNLIVRDEAYLDNNLDNGAIMYHNNKYATKLVVYKDNAPICCTYFGNKIFGTL